MGARNREEGLATRDLAPSTHRLHSATRQAGLKAMNQVDAPAHAPLTTAAKSTGSFAAAILTPSPGLAKVAKNDHPEIDHEDDEQAQQEQDNQHYSGSRRRSSADVGAPMIQYDGFESFAGFEFAVADDNDDEVNMRSPIVCKSARFADAFSPTCVSALRRDEICTDEEPSWTIQEFQEYLVMLEMLEDVCSNSEGEEMCLSAASLGQMERLLTSLLPQGV